MSTGKMPLVKSSSAVLSALLFSTVLQGCAAVPEAEESKAPAGQAIAHDEVVTQRFFANHATQGNAETAGFDSWTGYRVVKTTAGDTSEAFILQAQKEGVPVFEMVLQKGQDLVFFRTPGAQPQLYTLSLAQAEALTFDLPVIKAFLEELPTCKEMWWWTSFAAVLVVPATFIAGTACIGGSVICLAAAPAAVAAVGTTVGGGAALLLGCIDP